MSYSGLSKFKVHTEIEMIEARYTGTKPIYQATIMHKPILNEQCTLILLNTITKEQLTLVISRSKSDVLSRLTTMYTSMMRDLKSQREELDIIRQRRIRRYENQMKRINYGTNRT